MDISVIIVNYNTGLMTSACVESVKKNIRNATCEIIVVDNNSSDSSTEILSQAHTDITIIRLHENYGYGKAINIAFKKTCGQFILVLNSDILLQNDFSDYLIDFYKRNNAGIIGIKMMKENNKFQKTFGYFPSPMLIISNEVSILRKINHKHFNKYAMIQSANPLTQSVEWITGAFMFISRENFEHVGGFDEHYFMYYEDVDICQKCCNLGFTNYFIALFYAIHKHQATTKTNNIMPYNIHRLNEKISAVYYVNKYYSKYFPVFMFVYTYIFRQRLILLTLKKAFIFFNQIRLVKNQKKINTLHEILKNIR